MFFKFKVGDKVKVTDKLSKEDFLRICASANVLSSMYSLSGTVAEVKDVFYSMYYGGRYCDLKVDGMDVCWLPETLLIDPTKDKCEWREHKESVDFQIVEKREYPKCPSCGSSDYFASVVGFGHNCKNKYCKYFKN